MSAKTAHRLLIEEIAREVFEEMFDDRMVVKQDKIHHLEDFVRQVDSEKARLKAERNMWHENFKIASELKDKFEAEIKRLSTEKVTSPGTMVYHLADLSADTLYPDAELFVVNGNQLRIFKTEMARLRTELAMANSMVDGLADEKRKAEKQSIDWMHRVEKWRMAYSDLSRPIKNLRRWMCEKFLNISDSDSERELRALYSDLDRAYHDGRERSEAAV